MNEKAHMSPTSHITHMHTHHITHTYVYTHTGVYLSLNSSILPNHGYVAFRDIGSTNDAALLCNTNDPPIGANSRGDWYSPDRIRVNNDMVPGVTRNRGPMVVRLLRNTATGPPSEGMYYCLTRNINAALDFKKVYVGLYNHNGGIYSVYMYSL